METVFSTNGEQEKLLCEENENENDLDLITMGEMTQVIDTRKLKLGKTPGLGEITAEIIK
jgi:hypothetical protein